VRAAAGSLPYLSHAQQEASLQVVSGQAGYSLDGRVANASAGEVLLLPAGAVLRDVWPEAVGVGWGEAHTVGGAGYASNIVDHHGA
jgi:hypothetical protein